MNAAEPSKGNGAPPELQSLVDHGRRIQHDAEALAAAVRDATDGVQRYLAEQVELRPYGTLGVAAGIGYVLGGGLSARVTIVLFGVATRLATALVAREVGARLLQDGSATVHHNPVREHVKGRKERS